MKNGFAVVLLVAVLAAPGVAQDQGAAARAAAGCGPKQVQFEVTTDKKQHPEAEAGKAVVYVFEEERRDPNQRFGVVTLRVGVDGQWVGAGHGKSYLFFSVDPGQHEVCANWQSSLRMFSKLASAGSFAAEAGKVYYFRATVEERTQIPPGVRIEAVDPAEGQILRAGSALSSSHPRE